VITTLLGKAHWRPADRLHPLGEIRASDNLIMRPILERYLGDDRAYIEARKREVASEVELSGGVIGHAEANDDEDTPEEPRG
jgi:hypothetical protein